MASGDPVVQIYRVVPPQADAATADVRAGGSTPAENVTVWDFDAASDEFLDFYFTLQGYDDGGITFRGYWSASTATSGNVVWGVDVRPFSDDADDVDASYSYSYTTATVGAASASGEVDYFTIDIAHTSLDIADTEIGIIRLTRDANNASDTMTGDAELWALAGVEQ